MNALRLKEGVDESLYPQRTGLGLNSLSPELEKLQQMGLMETGTGRLNTTAEGFTYLNAVLESFLRAD